MPPYRVIHLGGDKWAVRRFGAVCEEVQFMLKVDGDPQLRSTEKVVIAHAEKIGGWRQV